MPLVSGIAIRISSMVHYDLWGLAKRFVADPKGIIRMAKRFFAKWNPGILDPGGQKWRTRFLSVPLYRGLGAITANFRNNEFTSFFGEHDYIYNWIANTSRDVTVVDIGAGDGISKSNVAKSISSYKLKAILVEGNGLKFAQLALNYQKLDHVNLVKCIIDTDNIAGLIADSQLNGSRYILSLDIDSYDLHVVETILKVNPPSLMCLEWNPLFQPPIEFSVTPNYTSGWRGDWFWGASIESWNQMLRKYDYGITAVLGVSFFCEPRSTGLKFMSSEEVYDNYLNQENRLIVPGEENGTRGFDNSSYIQKLLKEYQNYFSTNLNL